VTQQGLITNIAELGDGLGVALIPADIQVRLRDDERVPPNIDRSSNRTVETGVIRQEVRGEYLANSIY
jgi:hypothetical protein